MARTPARTPARTAAHAEQSGVFACAAQGLSSPAPSHEPCWLIAHAENACMPLTPSVLTCGPHAGLPRPRWLGASRVLTASAAAHRLVALARGSHAGCAPLVIGGAVVALLVHRVVDVLIIVPARRPRRRRLRLPHDPGDVLHRLRRQQQRYRLTPALLLVLDTYTLHKINAGRQIVSHRQPQVSL